MVIQIIIVTIVISTSSLFVCIKMHNKNVILLRTSEIK